MNTRYLSECLSYMKAELGEYKYGDIYPLSGPRIQRIRTLDYDATKLRKENIYIKRCFYGLAEKYLGATPCIPIYTSDSPKLREFKDLDCDGRGVPSQVMTNVKHLENSFGVNIDPYVRSHIVSELSSYLEAEYLDTMRYLTWEETINGFSDGDVVLKNVDMSSASGFYAKNILKLSVKKNFFNQTRNEYGEQKWTLKDDQYGRALRNMYEFTLQEINAGRKPPHLFTTTKKVELLPWEKAHKGRVFENPNCEFTLCERTVLGHFIAKLSSWDPDCPIAVGMNDTSNWAVLASYHARYDHHGAIDYVKWDKYLPYEIASILISCLEEIGDRHPDKRSWINAACTLIETLFNSRRAIGNTIYEIHGSMPSGSFTTAALNSFLNFVIDFYVFTTICGRYSFAEFTKMLKASNYGDDKMLSWNKELDFDMVRYKDVVEGHLGMRVDSDKKDGNVVPFYTNLEDITFLSRSFVWDEQIGWIGRLKRSGVVKSFFHTRRHLESVQHVQELFNTGLTEMVRHGRNEYGRLVGLLMAVRKEFPEYNALEIPPSYESKRAELFMSVKGLSIRYLKATVEMNSEAYNSAAVAANNEQAIAEHTATPSGRLVVPQDGMSQATLMVQPTMMMNNAQLVDDKNDTTACPIATMPLMQAFPPVFNMSIWTGHFTANHFIARTNVGAETPIGTIVFNYSSDVRSPQFPSSSPGMLLTKRIINGHDFYKTDFLIKVKLISATGTIGRLLVCVLPANFALVDAQNDITAAIKGSGYDYSEISANGDSTYTMVLRPFVNAGLASTTRGDGAGDLVEAVRVICVVSETFGTTYSEQAPNLTVTTEFAFGEGFGMAVPNTTLTNIFADPPTPTKTLVGPRPPIGFSIGKNMIVRIGTKRYNANLSDVGNTSCSQLTELTGDIVSFLNPSDAYQLIPVGDGYSPLFMRGLPPLRLGLRPDPVAGDTMLSYMLRWITDTDEDVEIQVLLNAAGDKGIPLTYSSNTPRKMFEANGFTLKPGVDEITSDYVFRVILVRGSSYYCSFIWCEYAGMEPTSKGTAWDPATFPNLTITGDNTTNTITCSCAPALIPRYSDPLTRLSIFSNTTGGKDFALSPDENVSGNKVAVIIGTIFSKRITDNQYPCLTITQASFTTNATTGTNAIPSQEHVNLLNYISRIGATANFDLVTGDGLLVAHCYVNPAGVIYVNTTSENIYREIAGEVFVTNLQRATGGEVQATPTGAWQSYVAPTAMRARRGAARTEMLLSAIGGAATAAVNQGNTEADRAQRYDLARMQNEENTKLANLSNEGAMERLQANGQLTMEQMAQMFSNNSALSTQSAEQVAALDKQKYAHSMAMQGLRDPSQANKIDTQLSAIRGVPAGNQNSRITRGDLPGMNTSQANRMLSLSNSRTANVLSSPNRDYGMGNRSGSFSQAPPSFINGSFNQRSGFFEPTPMATTNFGGTPNMQNLMGNTHSSAAQTLNRMQPQRATVNSMRSAAMNSGPAGQSFEMQPMGRSMLSKAMPLRGAGALGAGGEASAARLLATALI